MLKYLFTSCIALICFTLVEGQNESPGVITGSLQSNINFFMKDSAINAYGTPQYEKQLYSADNWLNVNFRKGTFSAGVRLDVFNNSYLLNPNGGSYTAIGLGNWFVSKKIGKLSFTGGYIYDQIGTGIIYRAYEERPLAIDNALFGVKAEYEILPDWKIKGFTGKQKAQLNTYGAVIKGAAIEGFIYPKKEEKAGKWSIAPGFGVVARTLDEPTITSLGSILKNYGPKDSINSFKSNTYAFSLYNNLTFGPLSWYVEGAYKTPDIMYAPNEFQHIGQDSSLGKYIKKSGSVIYTNVSLSFDRLGINIEGKRTENFTFRTEPTLQLNRGFINYIPALTRVNTYRLTARYNAATQFMGELAGQVEVQYALNDNISALANFSLINNLDGEPLYREFFVESTWKLNDNDQLMLGVQRQVYNQFVYEGKVGVPNVLTWTPFAEFKHKFTKKQSLRCEASAMFTKQDYGSWVYALAEYSVAPHWSFVISDMYNYQFNPEKTKKANNYPTVNLFYSSGPTRMSLGYVKQVEGIVCTGGICRYEPAFSGAKFTLSTNF